MSISTERFDVVVVGAGASGLYALHHFRERGYTVRVIEAGHGVGGTWYWNRYPGARCDVPSMEYSYAFSPELEQEWEWTEVFPAQDELERYFNHVADRFDLRRDIQLGTRVTAATYDDEGARWRVDTDHDDHYAAQFVVMATGCLSAPLVPQIPGRDTFAGISLSTNAWPQEPPDLTGMRVGLIGTGSSGVQATPELARDAAELHVFQRTPSYAWPAGNKPLDPDLQVKVKEQYRDLRVGQRASYGGVVGTSGAVAVPMPRDVAILEASPEERLAAVDELGWAACRAWSDVLRDTDANELGAELYREMVRRVVDDPETADGLSPRDLPIGCKRPILHTDYYETFNLDHVHLVDLRRGGIEEITPRGIRTAQGEFELDVIVFATGFDAMTGALDRIDIRGRGGLPLREAWADGARMLLGVQTVGFPNFFTITGPGSPSVLANMITGAEQHVEWIGALVDHTCEHGWSSVEPTLGAQDAWVEEVNRVATGTMYTAPTCNSWYLGDNIPGKARVFLPYVAGLDTYIEHCDRVAEAGYEGFAFS
ncbi:MAG TPA: NAD(P)/FAD-dependent oxidoreductase [Acidimicrobiia bacterium]|jgi:cyclohexanone monooxygenase